METPARTFSVAATGDILTEAAVLRSAQAAGSNGRLDFAPMLAPVAPIILDADLSICHMETPIAGPGVPPGVLGRSEFGGNLLVAPPEIAPAIAATGFDRCTTSSNHSWDAGMAGVTTTLAALDAAGVTHVGTARSADEASASSMLVVNGVRVAHLAYSTYSNTAVPGADSWKLNFTTNPDRVVADVAAARAAGAEVVIVSVHVPHEMNAAPVAQDRQFVEDFTARAAVDLVIEHGPHVVQPLERVNGAWVYWSVGNLLSGMGWNYPGRYSDPRTADGLIATARFTETSPGQFDVLPTPVLIYDEHSSRTVYPVLPTLSDPSIGSDLRAQLNGALARTLPVVPTIS
jgi:poly-gamma-glutamate synthesis protein (capsule biosynthesis protein)